MKLPSVLAIFIILILNQEYQLSESNTEKKKIDINTTMFQNVVISATAGSSGEYIGEYITEAQELVKHYPKPELQEHFSFTDIARNDWPVD